MLCVGVVEVRERCRVRSCEEEGKAKWLKIDVDCSHMVAHETVHGFHDIP
jgi:hypothetical protein